MSTFTLCSSDTLPDYPDVITWLLWVYRNKAGKPLVANERLFKSFFNLIIHKISIKNVIKSTQLC